MLAITAAGVTMAVVAAGVTNLPEATRGWRGTQAYSDAAHRVHARVEDGIRTGKETGIGRFPSESMAMNTPGSPRH